MQRSAGKRFDAQRRQNPLSYRSPGSRHKLIVPHGDSGLEREVLSSVGGRELRRYESFTLVELTDDELAGLGPQLLERALIRDDLNLLLLKRGQIDTTGSAATVSPELQAARGLPRALHMVQFLGPPTSDAFAELKATGAQVVSYIPNNGYLLWLTRAQLRRVRELRRESNIIQWDGPFHPAYKLDPQIKIDSVEEIPVSIEIVSTRATAETLDKVKSLGRRVLMPEFNVGGTTQMKLLAESYKLAEIARLPDVIAIEPWSRPKLHDERANQIVAGLLTEETINSNKVTRPTRPGFLPFLNSNGFGSGFSFAIDIGDSGLDRGFLDPAGLHEDFLDSLGASRIAYLNDFTGDFLLHPDNPSVLPTHDALGHGTLNAALAAGFNNRTGTAYEDSLGFQYGLGIAPFARLGISKLFDDDGGFGSGTPFAGVMLTAYNGGARISSNSWGICEVDFGFCNLYTLDSRTYDAMVRDTNPNEAGNQQMTIVFSSGNDGHLSPASVGMPGTAKNVITVGASENFRASDTEDGCGLSGTFADNAMDIVPFSSGGPVQDGRAKPDLVAPGTHITGAASQDSFFIAKPEEEIGVCDRYFPPGQTLYTWSSGTSHAAPLVSGAAALAFQWLKAALGAEPSPALVKAFILNSTSYLTGRLGADDLPGARQGWGLLNLSRMFEPSDRIVLDQSSSRTFTESGGAPFEVTGVISDPSREFRVMLAWTDPPGDAATNAPYVNQLNLEVVVGGVLYSGNNFSGQYSTAGDRKDFLNNVQGVRLPPGTAGPFVIRVRPTIIAGDGVPGNAADLDQDFAIVATNAREAAVPVLAVEETDGVAPGVTVRHSNGTTDSSLIPGEAASLSVTVMNQSGTAAGIVTSATLALSNGATSQTSYPIIAAGGSAVNSLPFQFRIPSDLRCGSVLEFQLRLATPLGQVTLPVRVRVGRQTGEATLLLDDVDSGSVRWKLKKGFSISSAIGMSGIRSYRAVDPGREDDDTQLSTLTLKKKISIPADAGRVRLTFFHIFNFEPGFDGGVLEISEDGGQTWEDLGPRIMIGGYDGKVTAASENPLGNRLAWTSRGRPGVFSQVVINLDEYAGKRVRLRFLAGFDLQTGIREGFAGWFVDDIKLTAAVFGCQ
ncbi:MAG TPA: S8 family serine peptidase [Blastocatellia bacterium]|nr:S8 family serine peptidase [Blastocatellia bacterium]